MELSPLPSFISVRSAHFVILFAGDMLQFQAINAAVYSYFSLVRLSISQFRISVSLNLIRLNFFEHYSILNWVFFSCSRVNTFQKGNVLQFSGGFFLGPLKGYLEKLAAYADKCLVALTYPSWLFAKHCVRNHSVKTFTREKCSRTHFRGLLFFFKVWKALLYFPHYFRCLCKNSFLYVCMKIRHV